MTQFISPIKLIYKKKYLIFAVTLLWILPAATPFAEQHLPAQNGEEEQWISRQPTFSELDKDQNGAISKSEAEAWQELSSKFDKVDENEDQEIDRSEYSAFQTELIQESILEFTSPE